MKKMYLYTLALIFTGLTLDTTVLMAEYLTMMHAVKPCSFQTRWPTSSD